MKKYDKLNKLIEASKCCRGNGSIVKSPCEYCPYRNSADCMGEFMDDVYEILIEYKKMIDMLNERFKVREFKEG